jgi:hypothetical protein
MEDNIERMKERHAREIKKLQETCKHKKATWMPSMWAPGHMGPNVKVCSNCGKELDREKTDFIPEVIELRGD